MRQIHKQKEPPTLEETRCATTTNLTTTGTARTAFEQLDKQAVRAHLAAEQGWLCAFCMRRINDKARDDRGEFTVKVAHRTPIAVDSTQALTWKNLLGSCDGGQRDPRASASKTCDFA